MSVMDDIQSPAEEPSIINCHVQFKSKLAIGDETTYQYLSKADNIIDFSKTIVAGLGGSTIAGTAWFATLGPLAKLAVVLGMASTPVGWIIGAGTLSAVFAYALISLEKIKDSGMNIKIPKTVNTPLDLLAQSIISLIMPVAVKMAFSDGELCEKEHRVIRSYFVNQWGFNSYFVTKSIIEQKAIINDFSYEEYHQLLRLLAVSSG